ncbi:MAG: hypothetical protein E7255_16090 [Lachnospiraceae bacterium]|nr:hypothetical protein [Lachnospiraceae bacterium]
MKYFCGSINPKGEWDIFNFTKGEKDSFYAHSKMAPGDIIVLVVGKQEPKILSGAYAILKCVSDLYKEEENGKFRNRINAECLYHSGHTPFITRNELEHYIHFPVRVPILVKRKIEKFSDLLEEYL